MTINSVLGPINADDLGFTLIHEHLSVGMPGWELDPDDCNRSDEISGAVDKMAEIMDLGVKSFVDPCPMELGRDPEFAAEVASRSGMQIVIATGLYNDALGIPMHFRLMDVDAIGEIYERELTEGIGETGIKAGIIKVATGGIPGFTEIGAGVTDAETKCLRAAAKAHKATGAPILCHNSEVEPYGREVLNVFDEEGVDFNKVLIGHACGVGDMRYYFDILDRGAWLGFDRFGIEAIASDKLRVASLCGLLAVGYDRIMLSHDALHCMRGRPGSGFSAMAEQSPNWNYAHICRNIIPQMRTAGVPQDKIDTLTVANPRNYFLRK